MQPQALHSSSWTLTQAACTSSSGIARIHVALDRTHGCLHMGTDGSLTCQVLPAGQQQASSNSRNLAAALPHPTSIRLLSVSPCSCFIAAAEEQLLHIVSSSLSHPSSGGTAVASSSSSSSRRSSSGSAASIPAARVKRLAWHPSIPGLLAYTVFGQCRVTLVQLVGPSHANDAAPVSSAAAAAAAADSHKATHRGTLDSSSSSTTPCLQWQMHEGYATAMLPAGLSGQPSSAPTAMCWVITAGGSHNNAATSSCTSHTLGETSGEASSRSSRREASGGCRLAVAWGGCVSLYHWQEQGMQAVPVATQGLVLGCSDPPIQMAYSPAAAALVMTFEAPLALSASIAAGGSGGSSASMLLRPVGPASNCPSISISHDAISKDMATRSSVQGLAQHQATRTNSQEGIIRLAAPSGGAGAPASVLDQLMSIRLEDLNLGSNGASSAHIQQQQEQQQQSRKRQPLLQVVGESVHSDDSSSRSGSQRTLTQWPGTLSHNSGVEETTASATSHSSSSSVVPPGSARVAVLPISSALGAAAPGCSTDQPQGPQQPAEQRQQQAAEGQLHPFSSILPLAQPMPDLLQVQGPLVAVGSTTGAAAVQLFHLQVGACRLQQVGTFLLQPQGWPEAAGHGTSSTAPGAMGATGGHCSTKGGTTGSSSSSSSNGGTVSLCQVLLEVPTPCQQRHGSGSGNSSSSVGGGSNGSGSGAAVGLRTTSPWLLHAVLRPRGGVPPGGVHFPLRTGPVPTSGGSSSSSTGLGAVTGRLQSAAAAAAAGGKKGVCRASTVELCLASFDLQPALPGACLTAAAPVQEPLSTQQESPGVDAAASTTQNSVAAAGMAPADETGNPDSGNAVILEHLLQLQVQMQTWFRDIMQQLQRQEARLAALEELVQR